MADFSTPQGALLAIYDAYRAKDVSAVVACKDFSREATMMIAQLGAREHLGEEADAIAKIARDHPLNRTGGGEDRHGAPGGNGPGYGGFPPGRPLTGSVTTLAGRRLAGRLVYDLDESETTETLDAEAQGVHYTIPFGLIASIVPPGREERGAQRARVTLHGGDELQLERSGDLGEGNAGMLIFVDGRERPEYVLWTDVEQVDLDRPPAMYPPLGGR